MAAPVCTNLQEGNYEDPITLEAIPENRLVHLAHGPFTFCYDALELLRYIRSEQDRRRIPTLPDNRNPLTPAGIEEVRRVARLSFPQLYKVVGLPRNRELVFATEEDAATYVAARPGQPLRYFAFADVEDPLEEDLLYPEGIEATPLAPIPGPYIDQAVVEERAAANRSADRSREQSVSPPPPIAAYEDVLLPGFPMPAMDREDVPLPSLLPIPVMDYASLYPRPFGGGFEQLLSEIANEARLAPAPEPEPAPDYTQPRDGEIALGPTIAREVRPGEWRCEMRGTLALRRGHAAASGDDIPLAGGYCTRGQLDDLMAAGRDVIDPYEEWGLGQRIPVDGEEVLLHREGGFPSCASDGSGNLGDPCRPDLIEAVAAAQPRRYLAMEDDHEVEYRFDRPSERFYCRNLDDPDSPEYECTDALREEFAWGAVDEDPDVIYRRTSARGPIECVTREEWHAARREGRPLPWQECSEMQREYLRGQDGSYFQQLESGELADEVEAGAALVRRIGILDALYERWNPLADWDNEVAEGLERQLETLEGLYAQGASDRIGEELARFTSMFARAIGRPTEEVVLISVPLYVSSVLQEAAAQ